MKKEATFGTKTIQISDLDTGVIDTYPVSGLSCIYNPNESVLVKFGGKVVVGFSDAENSVYQGNSLDGDTDLVNIFAAIKTKLNT